METIRKSIKSDLGYSFKRVYHRSYEKDEEKLFMEDST